MEYHPNERQISLEPSGGSNELVTLITLITASFDSTALFSGISPKYKINKICRCEVDLKTSHTIYIVFRSKQPTSSKQHEILLKLTLTPFEPPCPLQNLSVTLANWGMNRPTPFLMGAFAVIQPCFNQRALAVILLFLADHSRYSETRR